MFYSCGHILYICCIHTYLKLKTYVNLAFKKISNPLNSLKMCHSSTMEERQVSDKISLLSFKCDDMWKFVNTLVHDLNNSTRYSSFVLKHNNRVVFLVVD